MITVPVDMTCRRIRATGWRAGFIEFEFTVGDPLLTVELVMPPAAFEAFCTVQQAHVEWAPGVARATC
ncbi:phenol hydroxylase subunit [Novosphingobium nitrogenifigens]|nr:phenol hydroxylase subunit [Novosphingobium nitrogenifigens]